MSKMDFSRYSLKNYYSAINAVLNCVINYCFVKGVIETYLFVIDMGGKSFTSLPIETMGSIIKKMSIVYSMYLGHMIIVNSTKVVKISYSALKVFIHEETR